MMMVMMLMMMMKMMMVLFAPLKEKHNHMPMRRYLQIHLGVVFYRQYSDSYFQLINTLLLYDNTILLLPISNTLLLSHSPALLFNYPTTLWPG